jgi:hypothetical protein
MILTLKKLILIIALPILLLSSSCENTYTRKLWSDNFYNEVFYYFLISKDGQFVVFLNDEFHYVFNDNSGLMQKLLLWKNSKKLYINSDETILKIFPNNNVSGKVEIDIDKNDINFSDLQSLKSLGFVENREKFTIEFKVYGQRYQARKDVTTYTPRLSTPYNIRIYSDLTNGQKIAKASLSPLTVVIDAIMISGKILTFPFMN